MSYQTAPRDDDDAAAVRRRELAAARQRRRRVRLSAEAREEARVADRARKSARRASQDYRDASPESRWHERGRKGLPLRERPFVGVDGEAGYRHHAQCTGRQGECECPQEYAALTVGDTTLQNPDGGRLTSWQCLAFLTDQPRDRRYVGFYIDFDVTHILLDLPLAKLRRIAHPGEEPGDRMTYVSDPTSGVTYGIRYMPRKFLTIVRLGDPVRDDRGELVRSARGPVRVKGTGRRITIYDTFGYFQSSFLTALERWRVGTEADRQLIARGKAGRQDFPLPLPADVVTYNVLECRLLAELMGCIDKAAGGLGLTLRKYYGAGTLAELLLDMHDVAAYRDCADDRPDAVRFATQCAYFGGRFESGVVGIVPELHNVDIASAYPASMVTLPCLRHGRWRHLSEASAVSLRRAASSTLVRVRWDVTWCGRIHFAPFPYRRRDGSLVYPPSGHGWYWKEELDSAIACFGDASFEVIEAWEFVPACAHQPFAWVVDVYNERVRMGKNGTGLVLKLGLNSVYGKLAQTVGRAQYAEFVWAGMITARTRARLLEMLKLAREHMVMLATDGAYLDCPPSHIGLQTSPTPALGGWEYRVEDHLHRSALIVQSGFWLDGEAARPDHPASTATGRSRGISRAALNATNGRSRFYEAYRRDGINARVRIGPSEVTAGRSAPRAFVGIRGALHLKKPEWIGTWQPVDKTLVFDPRPKRLPLAEVAGETFVRTVPAPIYGALTSLGVSAALELSAPYDRLHIKDQEKDFSFEQPDFTDPIANLVDGSS